MHFWKHRWLKSKSGNRNKNFNYKIFTDMAHGYGTKSKKVPFLSTIFSPKSKIGNKQFMLNALFTICPWKEHVLFCCKFTYPIDWKIHFPNLDSSRTISALARTSLELKNFSINLGVLSNTIVNKYIYIFKSNLVYTLL